MQKSVLNTAFFLALEQEDDYLWYIKMIGKQFEYLKLFL